ncbi:MAG: sensor histidine kinase [Planctomycetales bacterium]
MFRVSARTLLHLGGELISSDGIAFYELIKNSVDAASSKVFIDVVMRLPFDTIHEVAAKLRKAGGAKSVPEKTLEQAKSALAKSLAHDIADLEDWKAQIAEADEVDAVFDLMAEANSITFRDTGCGMTLKDLDTVYLTVGTPHRLEERRQAREAGRKKVILGEKGIGRLAVMRLGNRLAVETTTIEDTHWNHLTIDWSIFARNPSQLLEEIDIEPVRGPRKRSPGHGTIITITDLTSTWSADKLRAIARTDLSRFTDPFAERTLFPIHLKFNKSPIPIEPMSDLIRENAHAVVEARLNIEKGDDGEQTAVLSGQVDYLVHGATGTPLKGRRLEFRLVEDEIISLLRKTKDPDLDFGTVLNLGPFSMKCYWFNRRILKSLDVDDELLDIKKLVRQWSGGLMVYRDGYRVAPYGGPDDDWLDLDRGALAAQGYKVNRAQLIGKVDITADDNPRLRDQTNREGFRDCPEKRALVSLLKHVLEVQFRGYLKEVDEELRDRERVSFNVLAEQLAEVEEKINTSLSALGDLDREHPELRARALVKRLRSAYQTVVGVVGEMQETVETTEDEKARLLHLAALGLSIEKLAHELNRAARHALLALQQIGREGGGPDLKRTASLQLESLQKRLRNLDPLLSSTRQKKEEFNATEEVRAILAGYEARFARHEIRAIVKERSDGPVVVRLVRAMLIQVLENLIENSVYWLTVGDKRRKVSAAQRQITIVVDGRRNVLEVSDNGPGIAPENRERVFRPFYTLKTAGEGKGLGLYIAREIAEYHGGSLILSDKVSSTTNRLHKFVLDFASGRVER